MTPGNIVGVDPHRKTLIATIIDARGGEIDHGHFPKTPPASADTNVTPAGSASVRSIPVEF